MFHQNKFSKTLYIHTMQNCYQIHLLTFFNKNLLICLHLLINSDFLFLFQIFIKECQEMNLIFWWNIVLYRGIGGLAYRVCQLIGLYINYRCLSKIFDYVTVFFMYFKISKVFRNRVVWYFSILCIAGNVG